MKSITERIYAAMWAHEKRTGKKPKAIYLGQKLWVEFSDLDLARAARTSDQEPTFCDIPIFRVVGGEHFAISSDLPLEYEGMPKSAL